AVDLRGHGQSQPSRGAFSISDLATDLAGLVESLELDEPPVLVGHSLGGSVAQQFVVDYPSKARGVVLLDSDLNGPVALRWAMAVLNRISAWVMRLTGLLLGQRSLALFQPLLTRLTYSRVWRKSNQGFLAVDGIRFRRNSIRDLAWALTAWGARPNLTKAMSGLAIPVLAVRGAKDPIVPQFKFRGLTDAIPWAVSATVEGAGHATILENPDEIARLVGDFLRQECSARACTTMTSRASAQIADAAPRLLSQQIA
ncbi:MAG: alpha/beta hydrolase, partial [Myxococcales bacterium]|nr:alpha/beta hydrolase [Myxococcales bacterium]